MSRRPSSWSVRFAGFRPSWPCAARGLKLAPDISENKGEDAQRVLLAEETVRRQRTAGAEPEQAGEPA